MHRVLVACCILAIVISAPFAARLFFFQQESVASSTLSSPTPVPYIPSSQRAQTGPATAPVVLGETTHVVDVSDAFTAEKLYLLINAHRKEAALSPLQIAPRLETSAALKIQDMIAQNYWQHADPSNIKSWPFFRQAGYEYQLAGENLSFAINTAWGVFSSWVASPTHNQQLLTPEYEDMGVAIDCATYQDLADHTCIVVLHLGKE